MRLYYNGGILFFALSQLTIYYTSLRSSVEKNTLKNIRIYIFMTIQYLKNLYLIPLNLRVCSVVSLYSFNISSLLRSLNTRMSLDALICNCSSISMSFLRYGLQVD